MGAKEERLTKRILFGYAGQLRPGQVIAGVCSSCQLPVWISLPDPLAASSIEYIHFSCHNIKGLEISRQLSRVIERKTS